MNLPRSDLQDGVRAAAADISLEESYSSSATLGKTILFAYIHSIEYIIILKKSKNEANQMVVNMYRVMFSLSKSKTDKVKTV